MPKKQPEITKLMMEQYLTFLREEERSEATLRKYTHDLTAFLDFIKGQILCKSLVIAWKEVLTAAHAPASVNSMLAAVNGFLKFFGWGELCVRPLKIQRSLFLEEKKELTKAEYLRLVEAAQKKENERLALVLQTLCATGIRVSELKFITVMSTDQPKKHCDTRHFRQSVL